MTECFHGRGISPNIVINVTTNAVFTGGQQQKHWQNDGARRVDRRTERQQSRMKVTQTCCTQSSKGAKRISAALNPFVKLTRLSADLNKKYRLGGRHGGVGRTVTPVGPINKNTGGVAAKTYFKTIYNKSDHLQANANVKTVFRATDGSYAVVSATKTHINAACSESAIKDTSDSKIAVKTDIKSVCTNSATMDTGGSKIAAKTNIRTMCTESATTDIDGSKIAAKTHIQATCTESATEDAGGSKVTAKTHIQATCMESATEDAGGSKVTAKTHIQATCTESATTDISSSKVAAKTHIKATCRKTKEATKTRIKATRRKTKTSIKAHMKMMKAMRTKIGSSKAPAKIDIKSVYQNTSFPPSDVPYAGLPLKTSCCNALANHSNVDQPTNLLIQSPLPNIPYAVFPEKDEKLFDLVPCSARKPVPKQLTRGTKDRKLSVPSPGGACIRGPKQPSLGASRSVPVTSMAPHVIYLPITTSTHPTPVVVSQPTLSTSNNDISVKQSLSVIDKPSSQTADHDDNGDMGVVDRLSSQTADHEDNGDVDVVDRLSSQTANHDDDRDVGVLDRLSHQTADHEDGDEDIDLVDRSSSQTKEDIVLIAMQSSEIAAAYKGIGHVVSTQSYQTNTGSDEEEDIVVVTTQCNETADRQEEGKVLHIEMTVLPIDSDLLKSQNVKDKNQDQPGLVSNRKAQLTKDQSGLVSTRKRRKAQSGKLVGYCGKQFSQGGNKFKIHKMGERPFKCGICSAAFAKEMQVKAHVLGAHLVMDTEYKCPSCWRKFQTLKQWTLHKTCNKKKKVGCIGCSEKFSDCRSQLKHQILMHGSSSCFRCMFCDEEFATRTRLDEHKLAHRPDVKQYKCKYPNCDKRFRSKGSQHAHYRLHTGEKPFICRYCGKTFRHYNTSKDHENRHFTNASCKFKCHYGRCGRAFFTNLLLVRHEKTHLEVDHDYSKKCNKPTRPKKFVCEKCDAGFTSRQNLKSHVEEHGETYGKVKHKCDYCDQMFLTVSSKKKHENLCHIRGKVLQCQFCVKIFYRNDRRKMHERVHTGEKLHTCKYCKKAFFYQKNMVRHMTIHTRLTKYQCDLCYRKYQTAEILKQHRKKEHGVEGQGFTLCHLCGGFFGKNDELKKHMQELHQDKYIETSAEVCVCHVCGEENTFSSKQLLEEHVVKQHVEKESETPVRSKARVNVRQRSPATSSHWKVVGIVGQSTSKALGVLKQSKN